MDNTANNKSSSTSAPIKKRTMVQLRWVLMPFAIILLAGIVLMVFGAMAPKPVKKPPENKAPLVEVISAKVSTVTFKIESQGNVMPRTETTLISEVSGLIKFVSNKFVVGGFFNKGELILEVDPINYEVALLQAQARLDGTKAKLVEEKARGDQAEKEWLMSGNPLSEAPVLALRKPQYQQSKAEVKAAMANVKSAQVKLANTKIKSPYAAMLKSKLVDVGQYVTTGTQLAKTFAIDYAEIRLPIKEQDISFLKLPKINDHNGSSSAVALYAVQGGNIVHWQSKIVRSEGVIDTRSRVDYVVAQIEDPYGIMGDNSEAKELRVGTFVNAVIEGVEASNIVTLPREVVRGADKVYVVSADNKLNIVTIDIIRSDSKHVYVDGSSFSGKRIIITKLETPIHGMTLRVKDKESETLGDQS